MSNLLERIRSKVVTAVWGGGDHVTEGGKNCVNLDNRIALGVLLWVVAEADDRFLPEETEKIKDIITQHHNLEEEGLACVLESIAIAAKERIDVHTFTSEVDQDLSRETKQSIVEDLFRVACVDGELDLKEHEMIRTISKLFRLTHDEFIDSKVKIKKEFGMDTAGL